MWLVSKYDKPCYIWFQQAFNNKVVIARCVVQILFSFLIFGCYSNKLQNMRNSEKVSHIALGNVR